MAGTKFKILARDKYTYLALLALAAVLYLFVSQFPGGYNPIATGLDPSWRYALNALHQSGQLFGRDVVFTFGPLGYLLNPVNLGADLIQTILFRLLLHGLLVGTLCYYLFWRRKAVPVIIFVIGYWLASVLGIGFSEDQYEYSLVIITCLLTCVSADAETPPVAGAVDVVNGLLAGSFLFMKLTVGLSALAVLIVSLAVRLLRRQTRARPAALLTGGAYVLALLVLGAVYLKSPGNFLDWLARTWAMADGFSVAMSLVGPTDMLIYALAALGVYVCLLLYLLLRKSSALHIALALVIPVFFSFKHGFARQDGHMMLFYPFMLAATSVVVLAVERRRELLCGALSLFVVLLLALPLANQWQLLNPWRLKDEAWAAGGRQHIYNLFHLNSARLQLLNQSRANLAADRLPAEWVSRIRTGKSVGTIPWEASYCVANNLTWDPFPTLQAYGAYKASLDQWSADHYGGARAPDFLLVDFLGIDERNLVLDTPATWRAILNNYEVVQRHEPPGPYLLQKRAQAQTENLTAVGQERIELGKWVTVPATGSLLYAFIDMRLRSIGLLSKTAFRIPPVEINLFYASGQLRRYRMIPDTARDGLLINYPPGSIEELDGLFARKGGDRVVKFLIAGPGAYYYDRACTLVWRADQNYQVPLVQEEQLDPSGLRPVAGPTYSAIDMLNNRPVAEAPALTVEEEKERVLTVSGWAVDEQAHAAAAGVFLDIDERLDVPAVYKQARPDVAAALKSSAYQFSGFTAALPTDQLAKGWHTLSLKIVTADKTGYYASAQQIKVEVK
ncbi:MAG: hypothetical protein M3348_10010 [Acidobacteriota bacterium]|nr:hypothetical protein [Acidobacteriota bacterium]